jgi:hypothetical protein
MHVISSGGIALALFLLLRGYRRGSGAAILGGWLVATWQFSLGFTLGLPFAYLLAAGTLAAAALWWRRGRPRPARAVLVATAAGMFSFALAAVLLARPYLRVLHDHPEARRSLAEVAAFSGPPEKFLAASEFSRVWGAAAEPIRDGLTFVPEQTLFPGLAILALALLGLGARTLERRLRIGLGLGALVAAVLSLGVALGDWSWLYPYRWLYELLPGWQGIRVPGRLHTFTTLCLALLAGAGAQAIAGHVRAHRGALAGGACAVALCAAVLAEGWGFADHPTVPLAPPGQRAAPQPALHLPMGAFDNRRYVLWSIDGFPRLVNGRASFIPRQYASLMRAVAGFPDARSVRYLRRLGVRSVTLHLGRAPGGALARASARPLRGLGLERERRGRVVRFVLR